MSLLDEIRKEFYRQRNYNAAHDSEEYDCFHDDDEEDDAEES